MKKLFFTTVAVVVFFGGLWLLRPVYHRFKERRLVAQARGFMKTVNPANAALCARQALLLNPTNRVACWIMAELAEGSKSPQALKWRQRLAELDPTLENQLALGHSALRYESSPYPTAEKVITDLAGSAKSSAPYHSLAAELALRQTRFALAEMQWKEVLKLEPTNRAAQINLAVLQLESRDPKTVAAARTRLEAAQSDPEHGLRALRSLVETSLKRDELDIAERFSKQLLADARVMFIDRMVHLTVLRRKKSGDFDAFLVETEKVAARQPETVYKLASWLNINQLSGDALAWIKTLPAATQNEQPVPVAVADVYASQQEWGQLETFLSTQKWGDREFIRAAMLTRAQKGSKQNMASRVNWQKSIRLAADKMESLTLLYKLAQDWGWAEESETLLWAVLEKFPDETWAASALTQSYYSSGNTRGLLKLYTYLADNKPDPATENNFALTSLLLGQNREKATLISERVFKADPKNASFLSTHAYALYLQGKKPEALKLFEQLPAKELEQPSIAAYFGILLAGSGEPEKARAYLILGEKASGLPEEKLLLADARKHAGL